MMHNTRMLMMIVCLSTIPTAIAMEPRNAADAKKEIARLLDAGSKILERIHTYKTAMDQIKQIENDPETAQYHYNRWIKQNPGVSLNEYLLTIQNLKQETTNNLQTAASELGRITQEVKRLKSFAVSGENTSRENVQRFAE